MKRKHIGIAAVSAEGAALCYRTICEEGEALLGPHAHPEITLHSYPLATYMEAIDAGDWLSVGRLVLSSAEKLRRTGADFCICPDNTVHQGLDLVRGESPLPFLHIAEEMAKAGSAAEFRRVLLLGTRYLMEGPVYPAALERVGIEVVLPEPGTRARIHDAIFHELVRGRFLPSTRRFFTQVIEEHQRLGCDAVVLGCTEIPLLVSEGDSVLPILDSTRILARAALRAAQIWVSLSIY